MADGTVVPEDIFIPKTIVTREMFERRNEPDIDGNPGVQDRLQDALRECGSDMNYVDILDTIVRTLVDVRATTVKRTVSAEASATGEASVPWFTKFSGTIKGAKGKEENYEVVEKPGSWRSCLIEQVTGTSPTSNASSWGSPTMRSPASANRFPSCVVPSRSAFPHARR